MKVLLAAYELPPSSSPQSLRWAYHVGSEDSVIARELTRMQRGWSCLSAVVDIEVCLRALFERKQGRELDAGLDLSVEAVAGYSWRAQAIGMKGVFETLVAAASDGRGIRPTL